MTRKTASLLWETLVNVQIRTQINVTNWKAEMGPKARNMFHAPLYIASPVTGLVLFLFYGVLLNIFSVFF